MAIVPEDMDDELFAELADLFPDLLGGPPFDEFMLGSASEGFILDMLDAIDGATRQEIIDAAGDVQQALIKGLTETKLKSIAEILADGLEKQQGVDGIARRLRDQIDLRPDQIRSLSKYEDELRAKGITGDELAKALGKREDKLIRERAELIARTETRNAVEAGEQLVALNRGQTHKIWITTGDSVVSDGCAENEAAGPVPINEAFPSGHMHAPRFPGCRCSSAYVTDSGRGELGRAEDRAEARAEKTAAARGNE